MNSKTRQMINEIKAKAKSCLTGQKEYPSDDAVLEHAVRSLHQELKSRGVL